jgi:xanthine dehydrogenase YagS FAD-binding subunit
MTPFRLVDAHSAVHAVKLLGKYGPQAQPIASGGDLLELLKEGVTGLTLASPAVLVNLATASELRNIESCGNNVRIGAMVTLTQLEREPQIPLVIAAAIERIASPQLRARTTLGGNLLQRPRCLYFRHPDIDCFKKGGDSCGAQTGPSQAHPGAIFPGICHAGHPSDLAPVLIALDAQVEIVNNDGLRTLALVDLYRDAAFNRHSEVQLAKNELLTAIVVPRRISLQGFEKIAPRMANEFSWASAAVVLELDGWRITAARIAFGGIAPGPWVCESASDMLIDQYVTNIDATSMARQLLDHDLPCDANPSRVAAARLALERALTRALVSR